MNFDELEALLGNPNSCVRDSLGHLWYPKPMGPELGVLWDQRLVGESVSVVMHSQTLWDTFGPLTEATHSAQPSVLRLHGSHTVVVVEPNSEPDNEIELEL